MPGDNCSVFGCGTSRRLKRIGIFKISQSKPENVEHEVWRSSWLNAISKSRVMDKIFKRLIDKERVFACEKHFHQSEGEI